MVEVRPLDGYEIFVRFEDGAQGAVDVSTLVRFDGVFESLQNRSCFTQVRVDPELGVVCWPGGADLDSEVLYSLITGTPLPEHPALHRG